MAKDFYEQLAQIMREHGCQRVEGGKGSHEKWKSPINGRTVTVPRSKSRHTANAVLKQLGIDEKLWSMSGQGGPGLAARACSKCLVLDLFYPDQMDSFDPERV